MNGRSTMQRCTCPRGGYSVCCGIRSHRNIAVEINNLFIRERSEKATFGERCEFYITRLFDSKAINKGLLVMIAGLLLINVGAQIYHKATGENKPTIIKPKIVWVDRPRDPNLVPPLEDAVNLHFSQKVPAGGK